MFRAKCALFAIVVLAWAFQALCEPPGKPTPGKLSDWTEADPIPLLSKKLIQPIAEKSKFKIDDSGAAYNPPLDESNGPVGTILTDKAAGELALAWLKSHFGDVPAGSSLEVDRVEHSPAHSESAKDTGNQYYTVVVMQKYRGIPTDAFAVVYIYGNDRYSASVSLFDFKPVPSSEKKIISGKTALDNLRKRLMKDGDNVDSKRLLASLDKQPSPRLKLVWSPRVNVKLHENILAPNWVIDKEGLMMVDAHTGEPWWND